MNLENKLLPNETISPIKFFISPSKSRENLENVQHLEALLITFFLNNTKWVAAQNKGTSLCTSIEAVKSKAIEEFNNSAYRNTLYPEDLKDYCDKLNVMLSICEDVVKSTEINLKQMKSLVKLNKQESKKFVCRTWSLENFYENLEKIYDLYQKELTVKRTVTAEIAHSQNGRELILLSKSWQYPEFADEDLKLLILFIKEEVKNIIKTS